MTTTTKPTTTTTATTAATTEAPKTKFVVNSAGTVSEVPADWVADPAEFKEATAAQIDAYKKPPAAPATPAA